MYSVENGNEMLYKRRKERYRKRKNNKINEKNRRNRFTNIFQGESVNGIWCDCMPIWWLRILGATHNSLTVCGFLCQLINFAVVCVAKVQSDDTMWTACCCVQCANSFFFFVFSCRCCCYFSCFMKGLLALWSLFAHLSFVSFCKKKRRISCTFIPLNRSAFTEKQTDPTFKSFKH